MSIYHVKATTADFGIVEFEWCADTLVEAVNAVAEYEGVKPRAIMAAKFVELSPLNQPVGLIRRASYTKIWKNADEL